MEDKKTIRKAIMYVQDLIAKDDNTSLTLAKNMMDQIMLEINTGKKLDDTIEFK